MNLPTHKPILACSTDGGETFIEIGEIQESDLSEFVLDTSEIGEMSMLQESPTTLSITVDMNLESIVRFWMKAIGVTNNMIRYHGGKPVRFVHLRRLDKCKSK